MSVNFTITYKDGYVFKMSVNLNDATALFIKLMDNPAVLKIKTSK